MGFNLSAFIGGAAEQANTLVNEERAQQKEIVVMRLKKAAESKALYNKKVEAQREEVKSTYKDLSSHEIFNNLTDDQQVSILKSPTIASDFLEQARSGKVFDIATRYKFKTPEATQSAQSFVEGLGTAAPTRDVSEQMKQLGTGILSKSTDFAQSAATAYGDTLEGLLPYEGAEAPDIAPMASFAEGAFKQVKSMKERLDAATIEYNDAGTPEEKKAAQEKIESINASLALSTPVETLEKVVQQLEMQYRKTSDPTERSRIQTEINSTNARIRSNNAAQAQLKEVKDKTGIDWTWSSLNDGVDTSIDTALGKVEGSKVLDVPQPDGTVKRRRPRVGDADALMKAAQDAVTNFLKNNNLLNPDGTPINDLVRGIMTSRGVPVPTVEGTPKPTTQTETAPTAEQPKQPVKESNPIPDFKDIDKNVTTDSSFALQKLIEGDTNEAYRQFAKDQNNPESLYGLGRILYEGRGEARNIEKGLQSLRAAAKRGSKEAQEYLKRIGQ